MQSRALFLLLLFLQQLSFSQEDSVVYNKDIPLSDRVFLTHEDFRKGSFIGKEAIVSTLDKNQLEFLTKVLREEKFSYEVNGQVITLNCEDVWGYLQNNTFYVNCNGVFNRIPVFGCISYLAASVAVPVPGPGFSDPRFGMSGGYSTREILKEFLLDFYDGRVYEFSMGYARGLLSRDKLLYAEYNKLSRRKQKDQVYKYIRKFNELHPIYFLKP